MFFKIFFPLLLLNADSRLYLLIPFQIKLIDEMDAAGEEFRNYYVANRGTKSHIIIKSYYFLSIGNEIEVLFIKFLTSSMIYGRNY